MARSGWTVALGMLLAVGCGPSMQSLYEGDVRFEHCYRLDLDREIAPSHRHACWEEWVQTYSYGQARDKIEYARRRLRYLEAGETSPPELNVGVSQATNAAPTDTPAHTDVYAPPPSVAPTEPTQRPSSAAALAPSAPASLPGQACATDCAGAFRDCLSPCVGLNAGAPSQCAGCEQDYGQCIRRCYE